MQDLKATCSEFGTNHPFTANILNEIGLVYDDKNDEIARQLYEAALRITLDTYGNNYLVTGTIRYDILFYTTLISFTVKPCIKRSPFDKEKDAL